METSRQRGHIRTRREGNDVSCVRLKSRTEARSFNLQHLVLELLEAMEMEMEMETMETLQAMEKLRAWLVAT
jgi:hypothetical protein